VWIGAVVALVALLVLRTFRIYRSARTSRLGQEMFALVQGVAIVTALAAIASYFARGELPRSTLLLFTVLALSLLLSSRLLIRFVLRSLRRHGRNLRYAIIVGGGAVADELARRIARNRDYGLVVSGRVVVREGETATDELPVLGTIDDLAAIVESSRADLVYLALPRSEYRAEEEALLRLADSTAAVRLVPDLGRAFTLNASVEDFDGLPVVLVTETPEQGWNAVLKRAFDVVFSGVGLLLLAPVMLAVAIWVKLDSPGPLLFVQERVGLNGRRFRMLKFRTMHAGAEDEGPGWTTPGDPRRTRAGRVLRALSLDELPQFFNVLVGQMSLVGPRPEQPHYVERFRETVPRYMLRHHVKAGITGWAQIHGLRGDTPLERRIEYDLYYIRHWSLLFDVKILFLTLARVFRDASAH
jgi:Undecaprenyl-phosphate glucose phosphotransferase